MSLLCPSMMCADYGALKQQIIELDEAGCDIFHCDVMDGSFVPNMTMGIMDISTIRKYTKKMVDVHLMIEQPSTKIDWFIEAGVDLIYIHPEAERYPIKTLSYIREKGRLAGIAINPDTSITMIEEVLHVCDYILVMSVNPGFAGQKFIDFTDDKIKRLIEMKNTYGFKIVLDGACSPDIIQTYSKLGVDGFVLGTSALFKENVSYKEAIDQLRTL
ncbi:ribulose-phosphate 3-epimerase [Amedibacillus sp. YH-ame10]